MHRPIPIRYTQYTVERTLRGRCLHSIMAHSRIPTYCQSPTASPPGRRALLIGISYASPAGYNEKGYRELKGPVNNAKEMKKALIGGVSTVAFPLTSSTRLPPELFHYKEEDIRSMTDEEANMNTALWPSKENIVSLVFQRLAVVPSSPRACALIDYNSNGPRCTNCAISSATHIQEMRSYFSVGICRTARLFPSLSDHLFGTRHWPLRSTARDDRPQRMSVQSFSFSRLPPV